MDRAEIYDQEQLRAYDFLKAQVYALKGLAYAVQDLLGSTTTFVSNPAAAPTDPASLGVTLGAFRIYQQAVTDATAFGDLATDSTVITQQGIAAAQSVLLSTAGISAGQSRWALIEVQFSQQDAIPSDDPDGGILNFWNSANPQDPFVGPANDGSSLNTARQGVGSVKVVYGTVATTGSEAPPSADSGYVGLYLVDLAFGQTQITSGQILTAGPSVGTNVPNTYPVAPILQGLVAGNNPAASTSHHLGIAGNAPKVSLSAEVQGVLVRANLPSPLSLLNIQVFSAAGTGAYTPTPGMATAIAGVQGGGAAGGSVPATTSGAVSIGAPGTSGAYQQCIFTAAEIGASLTVTVGAGGLPVASTTGGNGGASSFGSLATSPGGIGGLLNGDETAPWQNGNGSLTSAPSNSGGTLLYSVLGGAEVPSIAMSITQGYGGAGGRSQFGIGGSGVSSGAGNNATNPGSGGSGTFGGASTGAALGGAGADGIVIVWEFG